MKENGIKKKRVHRIFGCSSQSTWVFFFFSNEKRESEVHDISESISEKEHDVFRVSHSMYTHYYVTSQDEYLNTHTHARTQIITSSVRSFEIDMNSHRIYDLHVIFSVANFSSLHVSSFYCLLYLSILAPLLMHLHRKCFIL